MVVPSCRSDRIERSTFGVSLVYLDIGTLQGAVIDEASDVGYRLTDNFDGRAYAIGVTYAAAMTDRFALQEFERLFAS